MRGLTLAGVLAAAALGATACNAQLVPSPGSMLVCRAAEAWLDAPQSERQKLATAVTDPFAGSGDARVREIVDAVRGSAVEQRVGDAARTVQKYCD